MKIVLLPKGVPIIFFLSCGFFTLHLLTRQFLGLHIDTVALALSSIVWGLLFYIFIWLMLKYRHKQSGVAGSDKDNGNNSV